MVAGIKDADDLILQPQGQGMPGMMPGMEGMPQGMEGQGMPQGMPEEPGIVGPEDLEAELMPQYA